MSRMSKNWLSWFLIHLILLMRVVINYSTDLAAVTASPALDPRDQAEFVLLRCLSSFFSALSFPQQSRSMLKQAGHTGCIPCVQPVSPEALWPSRTSAILHRSWHLLNKVTPPARPDSHNRETPAHTTVTQSLFLAYSMLLKHAWHIHFLNLDFFVMLMYTVASEKQSDLG